MVYIITIIVLIILGINMIITIIITIITIIIIIMSINIIIILFLQLYIYTYVYVESKGVVDQDSQLWGTTETELVGQWMVGCFFVFHPYEQIDTVMSWE